MGLKYTEGMASQRDIYSHIMRCDKDYLARLNARVNIQEYSVKIFEKAVTFEAWDAETLVGLVAAYFNDPQGQAGYITSVSTIPTFMGKGIASALIDMSIEYAKRHGFKTIALEVAKDNSNAFRLYTRHGFRKLEDKPEGIMMKIDIPKKEDMMRKQRDYNNELKDTADHKYAYNFDYDVMHAFMIRSFQPFFKDGNVLELGSFKGEFTKRLLPLFEDITCIEASDDAIVAAKRLVGDRVRFVNALFETALLPTQYDNIIITHVLEHLDDPVMVLRKINDHWLSDSGRLFIACPNANAPSRQIAVKMGLIDYNSAITPAEAKHGHKITYQLDTLERDARNAGLNVIYRSGIFFKAFANFQWDRLLNTDIISPEYLEGCYQLGQQYPDLCSSIMLVCEKGK
jgi:ribosomal protein S18 acetylase RimI-like enzyme/SAM-dependent methyltransferase